MLFISSSKLFWFQRYLSFCLDFFGHLGKLLDKKARVDFKIHDVLNCETNHYNTHISRYTRVFFISNLGFCLELGLLISETEIGTGVA